MGENTKESVDYTDNNAEEVIGLCPPLIRDDVVPGLAHGRDVLHDVIMALIVRDLSAAGALHVPETPKFSKLGVGWATAVRSGVRRNEMVVRMNTAGWFSIRKGSMAKRLPYGTS